MEDKQHGGIRKGAGRPKQADTEVIRLRVPSHLCDTIRQLVANAVNKQPNKQQAKKCNCIIMGYTANGKPILNKCDVHR